MITLGLHDGHGASVALFENDKLLAVIEEERPSRRKGYTGFPVLSIGRLYDEFPKQMRQIDQVAVGTVFHDFSLFATKRYPEFSISDFLYEERNFWRPFLCEDKKLNYMDVMQHKVNLDNEIYPLKDIISNPTTQNVMQMRKHFVSKFLDIPETNVFFVDHHKCHANHALFGSQIKDDCLVITMDGFGDGTNATVGVFKGERIEELYRTDLCNIGRIYQFITLLLGMKPAEHEYKVMGLAAYAKDQYIREPLEVFRNTYGLVNGQFRVLTEIKNHYQYFKKRLEGYRFDAIAGALQAWVEEILVEFVTYWIKQTSIRKVVFSGGVALNIKASKKIAEIPDVEFIFVPVGSGDESISIGAGYELLQQNFMASQIAGISSPYLGPKLSSEACEEVRNNDFLKKNFQRFPDVTVETLAEILANGNVLANMVGAMEFGPRALGNRSFLADPRKPNIVEKINDAVKNRDFWMPFTPSILEKSADRYILNPKRLPAPYMTMAFDTTPEAQLEIPAAIHPVDKTARPQIVTKEANTDYYLLLEAFEAITGVGCLLNTSLNIHGKPIVFNPIDIVNEILMNQLVKLNFIRIGSDLYVSKSVEFKGYKK